ncbi:unnamed protein product [Linum trigynum]
MPPAERGKRSKPKANDPNKRAMSLEEKHKLGIVLQKLPEKILQLVVQIAEKTNGHLRRDGDFIELNLETLDTETLWELDRFVSKLKKLVRKIRRRRALMGGNTASIDVVSEGIRMLTVQDNNVKS